jgi:hypothetical protein
VGESDDFGRGRSRGRESFTRLLEDDNYKVEMTKMKWIQLKDSGNTKKSQIKFYTHHVII